MTKKQDKKVEVKKGGKKEPFTHVDRSNGTFLRKSELNKKKPWISPISNTASVEELTDEQYDAANA